VEVVAAILPEVLFEDKGTSASEKHAADPRVLPCPNPFQHLDDGSGVDVLVGERRCTPPVAGLLWDAVIGGVCKSRPRRLCLLRRHTAG